VIVSFAEHEMRDVCAQCMDEQAKSKGEGWDWYWHSYVQESPEYAEHYAEVT
jgi:hypothetical protein